MAHQMSRCLALAAISALLLAIVPLPTGHAAALMDFVPQEAGRYDTYYLSLTRQDCTNCHGWASGERHHKAPVGATCETCHEMDGEGNVNTVTTNCLSSGCHFPLDPSPHHQSDQALAMGCTLCHNPQLIGGFSEAADTEQDPPQVPVPTPAACANCHRYQSVRGLLPSTDRHYVAGGTLWANTYIDVPGFSLQPLETPEEPGDNGWLYSKEILNTGDLHHVGLYRDCTDCHAYADGYPGPDPADPILMRYCERCHSPQSLHSIKAHIEPYEGALNQNIAYNAAGWEAAEASGTADASVYRIFSAEERCAGCHGAAPAQAPAQATFPPNLRSIYPTQGSAGETLTISGSGFGQTLERGARLQLSSQPAGGVWIDLPPVTWSPSQISFYIPDWLNLPVGNYCLRVVTPAGPSNQVVFTQLDRCTLLDVADDADPGNFDGDCHTYGPLYSKVTVSDCGGFKDQEAGQLSSAPDSAQVNYFTQILLQPAGGGRPLIVADSRLRGCGAPDPCATLSGRSPAVSWSPTQISFRLQKFWDDANGNSVCDGAKGSGENVGVLLSQVVPGTYNLRLRRVYWKDYNGDGLLQQVGPLGGPADPDDEVLLVCYSPTTTLTVTTDPYIKTIKPQPVVAGRKVRLIGINFGEAQSDSTINIYKRDGVTLKARLTADSRRIRDWSGAKVIFRMPGKASRVRRISVTVGGKESNKVKVKLVAPPPPPEEPTSP